MVKTCRTYSGWDVNWKDNFIYVVTKLANGKSAEEAGAKGCMCSSHMKDGRGNIAPATIILPTLAMEAKKKAKDDQSKVLEIFFDILKKAIEDCRDELIERFNWICAQNPASARFMYENKTFYSYGDDIEKEGIRGALKHGTLAIGQIGLSETLYILVGEDQCSPYGMEVAKQIEQTFKEKCAEYKQEWYYTPVTTDKIAAEMIKQIEEAQGKVLTEEERKEVLCFCKSKQ